MNEADKLLDGVSDAIQGTEFTIPINIRDVRASLTPEGVHIAMSVFFGEKPEIAAHFEAAFLMAADFAREQLDAGTLLEWLKANARERIYTNIKSGLRGQYALRKERRDPRV